LKKGVQVVIDEVQEVIYFYYIFIEFILISNPIAYNLFAEIIHKNENYDWFMS